jgi:rubrerythrin
MQLTTASEIIRFAKELENKTAKFYEGLATRYPEAKETFSSFVKENRKNEILVQRAYNEVITDALETGFSFEGLEGDAYMIDVDLAQGADLAGAVKKALEMEEKTQAFYATTAEMSKALLADIPRAFERIAKKRTERKVKLTSLL